MKQSNNYFQKIALALVASILVLIPNLNVYSSVGSYRTSSPGISANDNFLLSHEDDMPLVGVASFISIVLAGSVIMGTLVVMGGAVLEFYTENKIINPNYKKYDFSGFDN